MASLVASAIGVGVCVHGVGLTVGTPLAPQPGFFPFLGGLLLVSLAVLLLLRSILLGGRDMRERPRGYLARPACLIAALGIYAVLLEFVGYPLMTTLISCFILRVLDTRWVPAVVASILLALGSFVLFVKLGVPLPTGQVFSK